MASPFQPHQFTQSSPEDQAEDHQEEGEQEQLQEEVLSPESVVNENVKWQGLTEAAESSYNGLLESSKLLMQSASFLRSRNKTSAPASSPNQ